MRSYLFLTLTRTILWLPFTGEKNRLTEDRKNESVSPSVTSDSSRPHGLKPTSLLCPWNSPGKNTGVGSPFLHPGDLPDPGIKPGSPALQADSLSSGKPLTQQSKPQASRSGCVLIQVARGQPSGSPFSSQIHPSSTPFSPLGIDALYLVMRGTTWTHMPLSYHATHFPETQYQFYPHF